MPKERFLVTVKTYPNLSTSYIETVCTAGIREDGSWIRLYPVPFRGMEETQQYKKFSWIECDVVKNPKDWRPESFRPIDISQLKTVEEITTSSTGWRDRMHYVNKSIITTNMEELITKAKQKQISLATFKPSKVIDFYWQHDHEPINESKLQKIRNKMQQPELFDESSWNGTKSLVQKIPFRFYYHFEDDKGKPRNIQVLDWEVGALYWNCLKNSGNDVEDSLQKVRQKYYDDFIRSDLHFFLGTTLEHHLKSPNPWQIIGVFTPPRDTQPSLF